MSKIQLGALAHTSQLDLLSLEQQETVNGGKKKPHNFSDILKKPPFTPSPTVDRSDDKKPRL